MPDPTLSLGISQDEVLISVLVGLISWFLTWLIGKLGDRLGGRAETIRDQYLERFAAHAAAIENLAASFGWQYVRHSTGDDITYGAADLKQAFEAFGARV